MTTLPSRPGGRHFGLARLLATSASLAIVLASVATLSITTTSSAATKGAANARALLVETSAAVAVAATVRPQYPSWCTQASKSTNTSTPNASDSAKSLQQDYADLKAEEPKILAEVPSAIRPDYQTIFNYSNKLYSELSGISWNFMKMPTSFLSSLASYEGPVAAASKAIASYVEKNCGIK